MNPIPIIQRSVATSRWSDWIEPANSLMSARIAVVDLGEVGGQGRVIELLRCGIST